MKVLDIVERKGFSATQLLRQLIWPLVVRVDVGTLDKARMGKGLAKCEKRLVDGGDESLQLLALIVNLNRELIRNAS
jgi:hypothetical protein